MGIQKKNSIEVSQKLNIELPDDPAILFLGKYPKALKTGAQTNTCTCMPIAALLTIAKRWEQPKCSLMKE